jgi:Asp-tRNA(Asn)/Glu-tRNA(Gln) amidotransferase A subunit family amidase
VPIELPTEGENALPLDAAGFLLSVEAAAAFDQLTRSQRDDLLERQSANAWPNLFRQARLVPAVEYLQANRLRTLAMRRMEELAAKVDVYVCPTYGARNLLLTNLTGHPQLVLPNGFRRDGTPTSITFTGRLFGENQLIRIARLYQESTSFNRRRPPLAV